MSQNSLWQTHKQSNDFAEICNALYERELRLLANSETATLQAIQGRLKSLPYYINRTAILMTQVNEYGHSPLTLDVQNASWSAKQAPKMPLKNQTETEVYSWYLTAKLTLGLVVPLASNEHIILDCIDRIDIEKKRLRTNTHGWFSLITRSEEEIAPSVKLLKPNKKVMLSACTGHCWQNQESAIKLSPVMPSLRELLLSCAINWKDFKQPLAL